MVPIMGQGVLYSAKRWTKVHRSTRPPSICTIRYVGSRLGALRRLSWEPALQICLDLAGTSPDGGPFLAQNPVQGP